MPGAHAHAKSVQEYIDELPLWADGTRLKTKPMTGMQWLIWTLAAFGKFFEGFVVFMGGVTVPLITRQFHLNAAQAGLVTSASLAAFWSVRSCSAVCRIISAASACSSPR